MSAKIVSAPVVVSPPHRPECGDISFIGDPGLTKQQFLDECDVNKIIVRCIRQGVPLPSQEAQAVFADVSKVVCFSDAMMRLRAADEAFNALPSALRARFGWDASALVAFVSDDRNYDEAVKLGILAPKAQGVVHGVPVGSVPSGSAQAVGSAASQGAAQVGGSSVSQDGGSSIQGGPPKTS